MDRVEPLQECGDEEDPGVGSTMKEEEAAVSSSFPAAADDRC